MEYCVLCAQVIEAEVEGHLPRHTGMNMVTRTRTLELSSHTSAASTSVLQGKTDDDGRPGSVMDSDS